MKRKLAVGVVAGALGLAGLVGVGAVAGADSERVPVSDDMFRSEDSPTEDTGTAATGIGPWDPRDDDAADASSQRDDLIDVGRAVTAARSRVPQGRLKEVELEWEHGRLVWSVELTADGAEYKVHVDAKTAEVVRVERDDD